MPPQAVYYPAWPAIPPAPVPVEPIIGKAELPRAAPVAFQTVAPQDEPKPAPKKEPAPEKDDLFGVDWDKIGTGDTDKTGKQITPWQAFVFAQGDQNYPKGLCRLVVIGTDAERAPVKKAFDNMTTTEREQIAPWFVTADHWSLKASDGGPTLFETGGKPTVYLLAPNGGVIHRQDGWNSEEDAAAIRNGLKKYDPKRDPDLRKTPDPERAPALGIRRMARKYGPIALVCGGACLVTFFLGRRNT